MIALKDYQERVLESLREFFRLTARNQNPESAFREVTQRVFQTAQPYITVAMAGLDPGMPYVCLRVPTGGGKTLLACYAAGLAISQLLRAERAVVLWLVPSNTILNQTADALRDPRHPYRRALELACGAVEVVTIEEALRLSRATVEGQTVVIVATIQSFRVEDTTGRKVYERAMDEGILQVFIKAGANIESSNCGPCFGSHMGVLSRRGRMISSSNRNYKGRMGSGDARIFLASPVTVAASAIEGRLADPRKYL